MWHTIAESGCFFLQVSHPLWKKIAFLNIFEYTACPDYLPVPPCLFLLPWSHSNWLLGRKNMNANLQFTSVFEDVNIWSSSEMITGSMAEVAVLECNRKTTNSAVFGWPVSGRMDQCARDVLTNWSHCSISWEFEEGVTTLHRSIQGSYGLDCNWTFEKWLKG